MAAISGQDVRLIAQFEAMQPGEHYCFDHCTVTVMGSPLCGRYKIVGQLAQQVSFTDSAARVLEVVDEFQDHPMPAAVEARHRELLTSARLCYRRRDVAMSDGFVVRADDLEVIGDLCFARAQAISAEWGS